MAPWKRVVVIGLVTVMIVPFVSSCSCLEGSLDGAINSSSLIFSGTVTEIDTVSSHEYAVVFDVETVWKGQRDRHIVVRTARSGASCGYSFVEGESYLVYSDNETYSVSLCSRTAPLAEAETDLQALGDGDNPDSGLTNDKELFLYIRYGDVVIAALITFIIVASILGRRRIAHRFRED